MDPDITETPIRVCIIGAGPSGLLTLNRFLKLGEHCPEVVCYEKQSTWGGQWNFTWRTDIDEYGEPVHSSIYKNLWVNAPKETLELPDYTFDEHFGRPTPSFIGLPGFRSFMQGLLNKNGTSIGDYIKYSTAIRNVTYHSDTDMFKVQVIHLPSGNTRYEEFSHVVVANGIFSTPFVPEIEGIERFPGLVLHSHLIKRSEIFKNKTLLLIGSMYSAEDIAMHAVKYGANHVIIAYRTKPREFVWADNIEERPMVVHIESSTVEFRDGTKAEVDMVVYCTGYVYHFPFLDDDFSLDEKQTSLFPNHLYKGIVWMKSGNRKLLYVGMQTPIYTLPMFDVQASWIVKYVTGRDTFNLELSDFRSSVLKRPTWEIEQELERYQALIKTVTCEPEAVDFMTEYCQELADEVDYKIDFSKYRELMYQTLANKIDHIMMYRDDQYVSPFTGILSPKPKVPWFQRFDDTLEEFLR